MVMIDIGELNTPDFVSFNQAAETLSYDGIFGKVRFKFTIHSENSSKITSIPIMIELVNICLTDSFTVEFN